jgi:hypothetical protein
MPDSSLFVGLALGGVTDFSALCVVERFRVEPPRGERGSYRAAKVVLVSCLRVLLQAKRLRFAEGLAQTPILLKELANYRMKATPAAADLFSAREGQHDDLVLGLAVACWFGEKTGPRRPWKVEYFGGVVLPPRLRWRGPLGWPRW